MEVSSVMNKATISAPLVSKLSAKQQKYNQHVITCEKAEGRKTPPGCHVHHINGIHSDNRPENVIIVPAKMHSWLHNGSSRVNLWMKEINWRDFRKELTN